MFTLHLFSGIFRATDWHTGNNIQSSTLRHLSHQIQGTGALLSSLPVNIFERPHWTSFLRLVCSRKMCYASENLFCWQEKLLSTLVETELQLVHFGKGRIVLWKVFFIDCHKRLFLRSSFRGCFTIFYLWPPTLVCLWTSKFSLSLIFSWIFPINCGSQSLNPSFRDEHHLIRSINQWFSKLGHKQLINQLNLLISVTIWAINVYFIIKFCFMDLFPRSLMLSVVARSFDLVSKNFARCLSPLF